MILPTLPALTACGLITQQVQLSKVAVVPPPFLSSEHKKGKERSKAITQDRRHLLRQDEPFDLHGRMRQGSSEPLDISLFLPPQRPSLCSQQTNELMALLDPTRLDSTRLDSTRLDSPPRHRPSGRKEALEIGALSLGAAAPYPVEPRGESRGRLPDPMRERE